jgi:Mce-associated membrane protein
MTNSTVSDDEKVDDEKHETADGDSDDAASVDGSEKVRLRTGTRWPWIAAVLVAMLLGGGVFGFVKFHHVTGELDQLRQSQADRDAATQLAKDYALKSLNYSFEDPDAFFRSVEDGVSQQLKDKYVNAAELLKAVMLEAKVSSTGEVLAADPVVAPDGSYQVVVSAHQTTRNLQNPTPKVSIILLKVTVSKAGDAWQVTDIGPETGTNSPAAQQLPVPDPAAVSAPAIPAPPR